MTSKSSETFSLLDRERGREGERERGREGERERGRERDVIGFRNPMI